MSEPVRRTPCFLLAVSLVQEMADVPEDFISEMNSVDLFGSHASMNNAPSEAAGFTPPLSTEPEEVSQLKSSDIDLTSFDRLVEQSILSVQLSSGLELPWK